MFVYDEFNDEVICPNNEILTYATTNKDGYSQYKSNPQKCKSCPFLSKCTSSKNNVKVYSRHVWESYMEEAEEIRHTLKYRDKYSKRKETIERVFADAKEKHHMRYAKHRGIDNVTNELYLLFSAMNIKKMALALDKLTNPEFI